MHYFYEGGIEKFAPHDHCLSSLGKPCDAKQYSSGLIFLSHHTLMIDYYNLMVYHICITEQPD